MRNYGAEQRQMLNAYYASVPKVFEENRRLRKLVVILFAIASLQWLAMVL